MNPVDGMLGQSEPPLLRSQSVSILTDGNVFVAISSEKMEITPLPLKIVNKMLWQLKPASHSMKDIAACDLMARKNRESSLSSVNPS